MPTVIVKGKRVNMPSLGISSYPLSDVPVRRCSRYISPDVPFGEGGEPEDYIDDNNDEADAEDEEEDKGGNLIMPIVIVNGKRVNMPSSGTSEDLFRAAGRNSEGRVLTKQSPSGNTRLKPGQSYSFREGDKFGEGPDRVKADGEFTYFGHKEDWQKQLITEQVIDVSQKMFKNSKVELDDDCNYVVFEGFLLPDEWQRANPGKTFVSMMIVFPDQYPDLPTNGFYLPSYLNVPQNAAHFYDRGYSGAFGANSDEMQAMAAGGWKWYCTHIKPGSWRPARLRQVSDWRKGDNLWSIITICKDVLTYPLDD